MTLVKKDIKGSSTTIDEAEKKIEKKGKGSKITSTRSTFTQLEHHHKRIKWKYEHVKEDEDETSENKRFFSKEINYGKITIKYKNSKRIVKNQQVA